MCICKKLLLSSQRDTGEQIHFCSLCPKYHRCQFSWSPVSELLVSRLCLPHSLATHSSLTEATVPGDWATDDSLQGAEYWGTGTGAVTISTAAQFRKEIQGIPASLPAFPAVGGVPTYQQRPAVRRAGRGPWPQHRAVEAATGSPLWASSPLYQMALLAELAPNLPASALPEVTHALCVSSFLAMRSFIISVFNIFKKCFWLHVWHRRFGELELLEAI